MNKNLNLSQKEINLKLKNEIHRIVRREIKLFYKVISFETHLGFSYL